MSNSFLSRDELSALGLRKFGEQVMISRKASLYAPEKISIGDHVRIDDFCILSGEITLGSYIHISAYTALYGLYGIEVADFGTISGRVMIYSQNDDYSGNFLTNPMVPVKYSNITGGKVMIEKHAIIAAGCIILPALTIGEGACVGAMSMVKSSLEPWMVYAGIPAKLKGPRQKKILELELDFLRNR